MPKRLDGDYVGARRPSSGRYDPVAMGPSDLTDMPRSFILDMGLFVGGIAIGCKPEDHKK